MVLGAALASLGLNNKENQVQITQLLIELLLNGSQEAQERGRYVRRNTLEQNNSPRSSRQVPEW